MSQDHFDSLETRDPAPREKDLFARLPAQIARAMSAPGWKKHLAGVDAKSVNSRAALAKLPLLRKSALLGLQKETPPFGGFNVTPPGKSKRLFMSPGPIFEPEGHGGDYNASRALFAAGIRAGDVVHNCFSYHLTPGAFILEAGAHALGCAVIPFSKSCSMRRKRSARTHPRSSAVSCRARRCRRRCARNWTSAASR